jgi:hypothetical protein
MTPDAARLALDLAIDRAFRTVADISALENLDTYPTEQS